MRLSRSEIPWAYTRGDPFRAVASLELSGVAPVYPGLPDQAMRPLQGPGSQLRPAETINQLASSWINFLLTKYPHVLGPNGVDAQQMRLRNMIFSIAWRPRDENEGGGRADQRGLHRF